MNGWMDGWMDGWIDREDRQANKQIRFDLIRLD